MLPARPSKRPFQYYFSHMLVSLLEKSFLTCDLLVNFSTGDVNVCLMNKQVMSLRLGCDQHAKVPRILFMILGIDGLEQMKV